jgi:hypothetical protein
MCALHKIESNDRFVAAKRAKAMKIFYASASARDNAVHAVTALARPAFDACLHCYATRAR